MTNKNSKIILHFTLSFCILIFAFCVLKKAQAATLYFSPSSGSYEAGKTFSVNVYVSSADQAMNAVSGAIFFPSDKLEAVSISKTGSIVSLWVQEPSFSNSAGAANFEGIVLNPGYTGAAGKIITLNFKAKAAGGAPLAFSSGAILANDGQGTNILAGMGSGNYEIFLKDAAPPAEEKPAASTLPSAADKKTEEKQDSAETISKPEITSPTHPDQAAWYNNNDVKFKWELPYGVAGVSILLNDKPDSNPGPISDGLFSAKEYQDVEDGIRYLHLKFKYKNEWSEIGHFKVQVDTTPPKPFKIDISYDEAAVSPVLYFKATDEISGIDRYEVKINSLDVKNFIIKGDAVSFKLPPLPPDEHTVIVKAIDKAGNENISFADFTIEQAVETPIIETPVAESYSEEPKISRGAAPIFIKIGAWEFDYFTVFVILLVFTVFAISFLAFWAGLMRSKLKKETDEAEQILHRSLMEFRKSFEEDVDYLIKLQGKKGYEKEKQAASESLKKKIDFMENKVLKEIKDIEDLLK